MKTIEHFVNGEKFSGSSKRLSSIFNPATGEQTAKVKLGSAEDLNYSVEKAKKDFLNWSSTPPLQRARVLFKFKELMKKIVAN
jgi:NAD-dependent aldehyde dehydrogenases